MILPDRQNRLLLVILLIFTLTSCASFAPDRIEESAVEDLWQARNTRLASIDWTLSGRVAVKSERENWQAHLRWRQVDGHYTLKLQSPFGQLLARLEGDGRGVSLHLPNNQVVSSQDPAMLLREQLGWAVPVTGLQHWVTGMPANGAILDKTVDGKGRLIQLNQQGWLIDYTRYAPTQGIDMPKKILLRRDGISIRLVIDRWELRYAED